MVCTKFWTDSKVKQLSLTEKAVFLYLITNPHTHLCGLYYLPLSLASEEIGVPVKWPAILQKFSDLELAYYDHEQRLVWVCKMFGYQGRGENIYKSVAKHLQSFHPSFLINSFIELYVPIKPLISKDFIKGVGEGDSNPPRRGSITITTPSPLFLSSPDSEIKSGSENKFDHLRPEQIQAQWNAIPRVRPCKKLEGALLERIKKMAREHSADWWRDLFAEVAKSKFLTGQIPGKDGKRPFRVDLNWVTGPINLGKILAGNYDDGSEMPTSRGVL